MKLYDIDYKFLFKNRNQVTLIIPILIANVASISVSEFERQKGQPLVSLSSALETMKRSLSAIASDDSQLEENVVILSPNITEIYKIQ
ncbi:hypothetical protein [Pedobacter gandavensis]|uniref:Uncharacterized protein n=1 Tax=Pedobacter gandavensis TaxID=2679963 RepID=A0ABR6F290_9SPHI|nr:hypothetical protein [Pedobacter gandavensis]MBB2151615.1 hypothetical protein [Pedobacter gandavensis]